MNYIQSPYDSKQTTKINEPIKEHSFSQGLVDAYYSANALSAYVRNQSDPNLRIDDEYVQQEKESGYMFNWTNPDVKEMLSKLPEDMVKELPASINSKYELQQTINRLKERQVAQLRLHNSLGTVGGVAAQVIPALTDWDSAVTMGFGSIAKIPKIASLVKLESTAAKTAAFAATGALGGAANTAVYQHVMNYKNNSEIVNSAMFGGILGGSLGFLSAKLEAKPSVTVEDPVYGPRPPTKEEQLTIKQNEVDNLKLEVEQSEATLKKHEEDLAKLDETKSSIDEKLSNLPKELAGKKKKLAELEKKLKLEETRRAREKYEEAKATHEQAKSELYKHLTGKAEVAKAQSKLAAEVTETQKKIDKNGEIQGKIEAAKVDKQEAEQELTDIKELIEKAYKSTKAHGNKVKNDLLKRKWEAEELLNKSRDAIGKYSKELQPISKSELNNHKQNKQDLAELSKTIHNSKQVEAELRQKERLAASKRKQLKVHTKKEPIEPLKNYDEVKQQHTKLSEDVTNLESRVKNLRKAKELRTKLSKSVRSKSKTLKLNVKTATQRLAEAEKDLENLANKLDDKELEAGRLKLNWLEKALVWTPGTYLHSSSNPVLRGIGSKLISPYKVKTLPDGTKIPTKPNAEYFKSQLAGLHTQMRAETTQAYRKALHEGTFKGSYNDFMKAVGKEYRIAISNALRASHSHIGTNYATEEELLEAIRESESKAQVNFNSHNKYFNEACTSLQKMYNSFGKIGKESGATGFKDITINGTYMPRAFDYNKLQAMGKQQAVSRIAQALREHPSSQGVEDDVLMAKAAGVFDSVSEYGILYDMLKQSSDVGVYNISANKQRKLAFYEDSLLDLLEDDINTVADGYAFKTSGRLALHKALGVSTGEELQGLYKTLVEQNHITTKDVENLRAVVDTILGTREIMLNPNSLYSKSVRILTKTNSIIYGAGFGLTSLTEIANITGVTGFRHLFGNFFNSIDTAIKFARGDNSNIEFYNELRAMGLMGESVHSLHLQKFDMVDDGLASKEVVEKMLDFGVNKIHRLSGLQHITEATRALSLAAGFNYIVRLAKKDTLNSIELSKLNRMGIDNDMLTKLRDHVDRGIVSYKDGKLQSFNFDKWDQDLRNNIEFALFNHLKSTVLKPDGASLPLFLSDSNSFIGRIMGQFMRFPAAMHELLFLRGMSEMDINQISGILSSVALFGLVAQIKDLGNPEPRYDMSTDDGMVNMVGYLAANNYFSGSLVTGANTVYSMLTGHQPFSQYTPGINGYFGVSSTTLGSVQRAAADSINGDYQKAILEIQNPLFHIPIVNNLIKQVKGD